MVCSHAWAPVAAVLRAPQPGAARPLRGAVRAEPTPAKIVVRLMARSRPRGLRSRRQRSPRRVYACTSQCLVGRGGRRSSSVLGGLRGPRVGVLASALQEYAQLALRLSLLPSPPPLPPPVPPPLPPPLSSSLSMVTRRARAHAYVTE